MDFMVILMRYFWCLYLWILRFWFRHRYPRWNQNEREFGEQKRRSKPQWLLAASPAHHHLHLDAAASQLCETRRKCLSVCELQRTQNHGRQKQASHIGVHSRLIRMILIQSLFPVIMKWQWQAHYYSELLCSMHCKLALWRHWNLILYNVIEREVRSSLNIAVSLAPCPSRIQTKWYSQIQTQLSHRAKSLQAHAHEATEPNCTSPLVPGSSIQVLWNSTSNITNFAKCKSPGWIITKKPCDTSGKDQTSLSALSIGCTSKSFTR